MPDGITAGAGAFALACLFIGAKLWGEDRVTACACWFGACAALGVAAHFAA